MLRTGKLLIALAACGLCAGAVEGPKSRTRVRLAGVSVGAGYVRYAGPFYGYPYWPAFGPFYGFYSPFYYPGYYGYGFARGPGMGEVRLHAGRDAEVFLDGAYAGKGEKLKSMWLEPGAYNLEVREAGREPYTRRIYVLSDKTLRIDAAPETKP
jgi:hypothetical protein